MSMSSDELREHLMQLPPRDRVELAYEMLESVEDEELDEDPAEVEAAWAEEIKRRVDDLDAGRVELISSEEVFAEARALVKATEQQRVRTA
jgi:putative addiction module component (TIGR02574 family)